MVDRNGEQSPFQIAKVLHGVDNIAYIAGFIDGEGCISVTTKKNTYGMLTYDPYIQVTNTNKAVLEFCRYVLGFGNIKVKHSDRANTRDYYILYIWGKAKVKIALSIILPYLIVKKGVAELVLKLASQELYAHPTMQDQEVIEEIRVLNKKGRDE
jgi:hypothetical protein